MLQLKKKKLFCFLEKYLSTILYKEKNTEKKHNSDFFVKRQRKNSFVFIDYIIIIDLLNYTYIMYMYMYKHIIKTILYTDLYIHIHYTINLNV